MDLLRQSSVRSSRSSRFREKPPYWEAGERKVVVTDLKRVGVGDLLPMEREMALGEGNHQIRKRITASKIAMDITYGTNSPTEENSCAFESRRTSSNKASGMPMKMLIDEEMSKEKEYKRPSPSVIARLMGLDALPTQHPVHKQKELGTGVKKQSSVVFQEKHVSNEDNAFRMSTLGQQEFKDVFEVLEASKVEKSKIRPVRKGMPKLKQNDKEMAFVRQKFMDAKRFSTDEKLQNSKEFSDALEVLDSNKDLFLKFLQEPNSLFTKHFEELQSVPATPQASHITILKSSNVTKYEKSEMCWKSERNIERHTQMQKDVMNNLNKYETGLISHSIKEHTVSLSHKLSKKKYEGNTEAFLLPTQIVLLKPNLEKVQNTAKIVSLPSSPENFHLGYRRRREFGRCASRELFSDVRDQRKLSDNLEDSKHKTKGTREIAREITKHMRHTVSSGSIKTLTSGRGGHARKGTSCKMSQKATLIDTEALSQNSKPFDYWNDSYSPSSSHSTEVSVNREARKHLSERWMMTHRLQDVELNGRCSSTLGEMLALSDREMPQTTLDSLTGQKASDVKLAVPELLASCDYPSGISSRDGWKDGCSRNLPRSRSLPASSAVYGSLTPSRRHAASGSDNCFMLKDVLNLGHSKPSDGNFFSQKSISSHRNMKLGCNKSQTFNSLGEENSHPVREIYCNQDEVQNRAHIGHSSEEETTLSESSTANISDSMDLIDRITVSECKDPRTHSRANEEQLPQPIASIVLVKGLSSAVCCQTDIITMETSLDHPEIESLPSHCDGTEPESPESFKEAENPSPVSVLEPLDDEEKSNPECFERVSADLKELRMQLQLLKLESTDSTYAVESGFILSDEEASGEFDSISQMGEIPLTFRDEQDRDFSYVLDVLSNSGVLGDDWDMLLAACYLPEFPVGPDVFEKLEKMYSEQPSWSRAQRRLLFDLINAVLAEILAPSIDPHPWVVLRRRVGLTWGRKGLAEEVWQLLVGHRMEDSSDPADKVLERDTRWLDVGDDVDIIGREIESMLKNDILEEVISEFIVQ